MIDKNIFVVNLTNQNLIKKLMIDAISNGESIEVTDQSNRNGRQSSNLANIKELFGFYDSLKKILINKSSKKYNNISLKSAYFCINQKYSFNHINSYSNGEYSGIIWLKHGKKCGSLKILDESKKNIIVNEKNYLKEIRPSVGDIVFFPSNYSHLIEMNLDDVPQVFMKFNFVIKNG